MTETKIAVFAAWLAWVCPAFAQPAPELKRPVVEGSTRVPYPAHATGDAVVVLELLVDKDGSVAEVALIEGADPFAARAESAVRAWRFRPARRGEVAVAARIRARIEFKEDSEEPPPRRGAASAETPSTAALPTRGSEANAAAQPPTEIFVRGHRREVGETTLTVEEVREIPGGFGDPFRAVEILPGVTPLVSGVPYFFIRGTPPNNHGYFLDGIPVPLLFHVGLGAGVLHPALLERIDIYSGAAPARFGRVAGAIVSAETRRPLGRAHGEASLRLVDAGALVEAPFANGRASALVAGRYGYPGPVLSAISDVRLDYWDYQARTTWRVGERDTISLLAFGSHDYLGHLESPEGTSVSDSASSKTTTEDFVSDFHRIDLRHDRAWSDGRFRIAGTVGYDSQGANPTYLTNKSAAVRFDLEQDVTRTVRVRSGLDARIDDYGLREDAPVDPTEAVVPSTAAPPRRNLTAGAYADFVWRPAPRIEITPGARVGIFDSTRPSEPAGAPRVRTTIPAVDPRLSARVLLAKDVAWLSTFGLSHQYPALRVGSVPAIVTGAGFPLGNAQLQETSQASQGIELGLPADMTFTATGFLARSTGLTDLTAACIQIEPPMETVSPGQGPPPRGPYLCPSNAPVRSHTFGLELLLRRPLTKRLTGWLAYTLSRSVRTAHFLRLDGTDTLATVPSEFDRTHVLNALLAYDLGRRWRAGTRFVFYSGVPYSTLAGNIPVPPYHDKRDPPFFRLDLRLEKRWVLGQNQSIALVFEGQNVTLSKDANTLGMDCIGEATGDTATTECQRGKVGPITIPSIGVEAIF